MEERKKPLHNKYDRKTLEEKLGQETFERITVSLYRYVHIDDPKAFRNELYEKWSDLNINGRIYVAKEGINAQFSCPEPNWKAFIETVQNIDYLKDVPLKIAVEDDGKSFLKLAIKVRKKILADGMDDNSYDVTNVGKHLTAEEWNKHMENPNTIIVDVRNHYEHEVGHFKGAINSESDTFREDLIRIKEKIEGNEDKKVLLYCTGGIRCEKTSAYLKHHGFEDVNQLHGGIIDYARQIKAQGLENKFLGKNFVFDDRLGERISDDVISSCHQCGEPCDAHTNCQYMDCNLLFIQCETCKKTYENCCSEECLSISKLPMDEQKEIRKEREKQGLMEFKRSMRPKTRGLNKNDIS